MTTKNTHGGAGRNQGRKAGEYGKRLTFPVRLRPDHHAEMVSLQPNTSQVFDLALEIAIPAFKAAKGDPCKLAALIAFNALSEAIITLENTRDHDPVTGLFVEESEFWREVDKSLHKTLNEAWDRLRLEGIFT